VWVTFFGLAYVPPPEEELGGASEVSADGDSSVGGGTGAGASALVGTYVPAAEHHNTIATAYCHRIAAMMKLVAIAMCALVRNVMSSRCSKWLMMHAWCASKLDDRADMLLHEVQL